MSTKKRGRYSNGKQVPIAPEFDQAVPSSPILLPTKTPYRPIPQSYSTNSSTSSNISTSSSGSTFDVEKSTSSLDESPTTSDEDSSRPKRAAQFGSLSDITSPLAPKKNGRRKIPTNLKSNISSRSVDISTSSKPASGIQTRSSKLRSSLTASKREFDLSSDGSLSALEVSPITIRSTSAPPPSATLRQSQGGNENEELDIDRLWHLPGRYESWNSNFDIEIEDEARAKGADEFGDSAADDAPSVGSPFRDRLQTQTDAFTPQDGQGAPEEIKAEASPTPGAANQDKYGKSGVSRSTYQRPNFVPFGCSDDDPTKHKQTEKKVINNRMLNYIKQEQKSHTKSGWIYMYKHEPPEHKDLHLKIGKSEDTSDVRLAEWRKCNLPFKEILDDYENPFVYYGFVESILKIELQNVRKKFYCQVCEKFHDEWFEVDVSIPLKKRQTWRNWLRIQKPFKDGQLKPYWEWRVQRAKLNVSDLRWEEWTQPGPLDLYHYYFETFDKIGLVAHFSLKRKDSWFWFMAIIITLLLYINFGQPGALWGVLAMLAL